MRRLGCGESGPTRRANGGKRCDSSYLLLLPFRLIPRAYTVPPVCPGFLEDVETRICQVACPILPGGCTHSYILLRNVLYASRLPTQSLQRTNRTSQASLRFFGLSQTILRVLLQVLLQFLVHSSETLNVTSIRGPHGRESTFSCG